MIRVRLLWSSVVPLLLVFSAQAYVANRRLSITLFIFAIVGGLNLIDLLWAREQLSPQEYTVVRVDDESDQVPAYLVSYILPFVSLQSENMADLVSYAVLALMVGVLVTRSNIVFVQPLLLLTGWRMYRVRAAESEDQMIIVGRKQLRRGMVVITHSLSGQLKRFSSMI